MSCTVIIIGHQPANRLDPQLLAPATRSPLVAKVQGCHVCTSTEQVVLSPDSDAKDGYRISYDSAATAKPAETHLLRFASRAAARQWLEALDRRQLVGKQVLVIDPDGDDDGGAISTAPETQ